MDLGLHAVAQGGVDHLMALDQALAFEGMEPLALSFPLVALVLANFSFLPALPVILIAELTGRRDWLFHALGGAVVTVLAVALSWSMDLSAWRRVGEGAPATDPREVRIGDDALVGIGAVVVKDVDANTVVAGVPAKPRGPRYPEAGGS